MKRLTKAAIVLLAMLLVPASAYATKCHCRQHKADAEANGTCSRSEDETRCTLTFTTTPPKEYDEFVARLRKLNLTADPREVLRDAFAKPPEAYGEKFVPEYLPILFSISQRTYFLERTPQIVKVIRENKNKIERVFLNPEFKRKAVREKLLPFEAIMSYGCIEIKDGSFYSMVKTRWAEANLFCDDFPK